jgi:hypothetical protein
MHPEGDYSLLDWTVDIAKLEIVTKVGGILSTTANQARLTRGQMICLSVLPFFTSLYFWKLALLATYMQIFLTFMQPLRIALYATVAFCICGYIVSMPSHISMCWPVKGNW